MAGESEGLRLAQVANFVGPRSGGLRVVVETLGAAHVRDSGERLVILPDLRAGATRQGRDRLIAVPSPVLPGSRGRYRVLLRRRAVVATLEEFGPDVVEVHDQTTLTWVADWAARAGVPCVLFSHERLDQIARELVRLPSGPCGRIARRLAERLAGRVDAVVCASDFAAEPFSRATNVHRIPFGVDLDTFSPAAAGPETPWQRDVFRLVFSGRMHPEKCPDLAVEVLARLHRTGLPVELVMLGSGPLELSLRRRVRRQRLPVRLLGHVQDRARLAGILAAADLALSPGPRETFGLSVLEALACGTPVAVSSRGSSRELLAPGAGVAADDPAELTALVRELLVDSAALSRASALARRRASAFPWSATLEALARLRSDLTGRRNPTGTTPPATTAPTAT